MYTCVGRIGAWRSDRGLGVLMVEVVMVNSSCDRVVDPHWRPFNSD